MCEGPLPPPPRLQLHGHHGALQLLPQPALHVPAATHRGANLCQCESIHPPCHFHTHNSISARHSISASTPAWRLLHPCCALTPSKSAVAALRAPSLLASSERRRAAALASRSDAAVASAAPAPPEVEAACASATACVSSDSGAVCEWAQAEWILGQRSMWALVASVATGLCGPPCIWLGVHRLVGNISGNSAVHAQMLPWYAMLPACCAMLQPGTSSLPACVQVCLSSPEVADMRQASSAHPLIALHYPVAFIPHARRQNQMPAQSQASHSLIGCPQMTLACPTSMIRRGS